MSAKSERLNLEKTIVLLVDGNAWGMRILKQIFAGFGVRAPRCASTIAEAQEIISTEEINLVVTNDIFDVGSAAEFCAWLRRSGLEPNSFTPVIILSGHTKRSAVHALRDCGANFTIAKPVSAQVLIERIAWVAREARPFIEAGSYLGPDRRFHDAGPPSDGGRRKGDPPPEAAGKAPPETQSSETTAQVADSVEGLS